MLNLISLSLAVSSLLQPICQWFEGLKIDNPKIARSFCYFIPAQCPFERDICIFNRKLFHIPPLCKLNPFYEHLMLLRFKALSYLADECGEDISLYCQ